MQADLAVRALADRRRALVGWVLGIAAYMAMIVAFWPSVRGASGLAEAVQDYPDAVKELLGGAESFDFSTAAGYLNAELFSFMLPFLLVTFSIGFGAAALAGEEERGLLDLVLAQPVARPRLVTERAFALVVGVAGLAVTAAIAVLVAGAVVDLGVEAGNVLAACTGAGLLAIVYGFVALLAGAVLGTRAGAIAVAAALFVAGYLVQALAGLVDGLEPLRPLVPLYLANGALPIRRGWPLGEFSVLLCVAAVLFVLSVVVFTRRDLAE